MTNTTEDGKWGVAIQATPESSIEPYDRRPITDEADAKNAAEQLHGMLRQVGGCESRTFVMKPDGKHYQWPASEEVDCDADLVL